MTEQMTARRKYRLRKLKIAECSLVDKPANPHARAVIAKGGGDVPVLQELDDGVLISLPAVGVEKGATVQTARPLSDGHVAWGQVVATSEENVIVHVPTVDSINNIRDRLDALTKATSAEARKNAQIGKREHWDQDIFAFRTDAESRSHDLGLEGRVHVTRVPTGQAVFRPGQDANEYFRRYANAGRESGWHPVKVDTAKSETMNDQTKLLKAAHAGMAEYGNRRDWAQAMDQLAADNARPNETVEMAHSRLLQKRDADMWALYSAYRQADPAPEPAGEPQTTNKADSDPLEALAKRQAAEDGTDFYTAYAKVASTEEGRRRMAQTRE